MKSSFTRALRSVRPVTWKPNMRSGGLKDMKVVGIERKLEVPKNG
jgi:hypothetical protein